MRGAATHEAVQGALARGGVQLRVRRYGVRWWVAGCGYNDMNRYGVSWRMAGGGYACSGMGFASGWRSAATHEAVQGALAGGGMRLRMKRYGVHKRVAEWVVR